MPTNNSTNVHSVDTLIGKTVLSRTTGNKLGEINDLIVDPNAGMVIGLVANSSAEKIVVIDSQEVSNFGEDAIMVNHDGSITESQNSPLSRFPLAKKNLIGAKIITEGGKLLGEVANIFVHTSHAPYSYFYQVQESLLDRLLRRTIFIPATEGLAISERAERIIVSDDTLEKATDDVETLISRVTLPGAGSQTFIRGLRPAALQAFRAGSFEINETGEEPVIQKRPHVVEEVVVHKRQTERTESINETLRNTEVDVQTTK